MQTVDPTLFPVLPDLEPVALDGGGVAEEDGLGGEVTYQEADGTGTTSSTPTTATGGAGGGGCPGCGDGGDGGATASTSTAPEVTLEPTAPRLAECFGHVTAGLRAAWNTRDAAELARTWRQATTCCKVAMIVAALMALWAVRKMLGG